MNGLGTQLVSPRLGPFGAAYHPSTNRARCRLTSQSKASVQLTAPNGLPKQARAHYDGEMGP